MKVSELDSEVVANDLRLDARYHLDHQTTPAPASGRSIGDMGQASWPARQRLAIAAQDEASVPYLRPYDVFDYLPTASTHVSAARYEDIETYRVKRGMILQTCSGRNLGPSALADEHLSRFMVSNDLIRLTIGDEVDRLLTACYLKTSVGISSLRRGRSGSVIDHIAPAQVEALKVPDVPTAVRDLAAGDMALAYAEREKGRNELWGLIAEVEMSGPTGEDTKPLRAGFTAMSTELEGRLDVAPHNPLVLRIREALDAAGGSCVADVADVRKPQGRYRPRYVTQPYGTPYMSGRQILQATPVNLKYVAEDSLPDAKRFALDAGWIVYQADGRAEEGLGTPVVVVPARAGWFASGHVGRVIPKVGQSFGRLYLALAAWQSQLQLRSLASGSVVDSTFEWDMSSVLLPAVSDAQASRAEAAWARLNEAEVVERRAVHELERWLSQASEGIG